MSDFDTNDLNAVDALIDGVTPLVGLTIDEASRPVVVMHLRTAVRLGRLVLDFPLVDELEHAPVYTP
jgi:hypothetical protein